MASGATSLTASRFARIPGIAHVPTIACDLVGGVALARAVRDLVGEGLLYSNGTLVLPSRPALHVKRLNGGDG